MSEKLFWRYLRCIVKIYRKWEYSEEIEVVFSTGFTKQRAKEVGDEGCLMDGCLSFLGTKYPMFYAEGNILDNFFLFSDIPDTPREILM